MKMTTGQHAGAEIVGGEWGDTIIVGPPARRELTEEERAAAKRADRLPLSELLKLVGGDLDLAKAYGLPPSIGRTVGGWTTAGEPFWSRTEVKAWRDRLKAFAASVQ